jgi:hypothetical protein
MSASASFPFVRRQATPGWVAINFSELWRYRELLMFQAIRDIKVRYKQTVLGAWTSPHKLQNQVDYLDNHPDHSACCHGTKLFNTAEGGACVTNDGALAERLRRLRFFGFDDKEF